DLTDYLTRNRAEDEPAMNVLGFALNVSATQDPNIKKSALWNQAFKEWDRRNYLLDHGRPGYRRWGTAWITDEAYKEIDSKRAELRLAVDDQTERLRRLALTA